MQDQEEQAAWGLAEQPGAGPGRSRGSTDLREATNRGWWGLALGWGLPTGSRGGPGADRGGGRLAAEQRQRSGTVEGSLGTVESQRLETAAQ